MKCPIHLFLQDATEGPGTEEAFTKPVLHSALPVAWRQLGRASPAAWLCPLSQVRDLWSERRRPPEATPEDKQTPQDRRGCPSLPPLPSGGSLDLAECPLYPTPINHCVSPCQWWASLGVKLANLSGRNLGNRNPHPLSTLLPALSTLTAVAHGKLKAKFYGVGVRLDSSPP